MCGRFTLTVSYEELIEQFLIDEIVDEWGPKIQCRTFSSSTFYDLKEREEKSRTYPVGTGALVGEGPE